MSKKCVAFSESKLGLETADNRKAFYAGWEAAVLAEREAFKVYVNQAVADREMAVHDAVLSEREACAKVCEEFEWYGEDMAAAIRARSNNG